LGFNLVEDCRRKNEESQGFFSKMAMKGYLLILSVDLAMDGWEWMGERERGWPAGTVSTACW
jgi:hypothetical protein